jgi:hypothetical protein
MAIIHHARKKRRMAEAMNSNQYPAAMVCTKGNKRQYLQCSVISSQC